jgi:hypothetical protein
VTAGASHGGRRARAKTMRRADGCAPECTMARATWRQGGLSPIRRVRSADTLRRGVRDNASYLGVAGCAQKTPAP